MILITRKILVAAVFCFVLPALAQTGATLPAMQTANVSTPLKSVGAVVRPVLVSSVEPEFPHSRFHRHQNATVVVGLTVAKDGMPANLHIVQSASHDFDKSALAAVSQYRFKPATLHGQPVPFPLTVQVDFQKF